MLYLAVLRAGLRLPAAEHRLPGRRDRILHRQRRAGGGGVRAARTSAGSVEARLPGRHAARLHARRRPQRQPARARRACSDRHDAGAARAPTTWPPSSTPAAPPGAARARCSATATCSATRVTLKTLLGLARRPKGGDVLIHALPIFHVHGLFVASHGALLNGSKMIWFGRSSTPTAVIAQLPRGHGLHGRADAVRAPAGRARR